MKHPFHAIVVAGALMLTSCATKKYVAQTVDPVKQQVGQVNTQLDQTRKQVEQNEAQLSATTEKANAADARASDALNKADAASQKAEQVRSDLRNELRDVVANLDDYKQVSAATVHFKFNSDKLSAEDSAQLDQMVAQHKATLKRYFIAVEGFTDRTGSEEYNNELSRRRANAVVQYLVAKQGIPVYRIHVVGLGKLRPVDEAKTREAHAKNRRAEVTLFSADASVVAAQKQ